MATWKTYKIADILSEIEKGKFILPAIHRPLIWGEEKMELLFDTLLKGYPFGEVMVFELEKGSKPIFDYRTFSRDGYETLNHYSELLPQNQYFIIDGQQRLQSFYMGIKGSFNGKSLYFDLFSDSETAFEFQFAYSPALLPKHTKGKRPIGEHNWHLVSTLFESLNATSDEHVIAEIILTEGITDIATQEQLFRNIRAFYRNIFTAETLGVSKVAVNKALSETTNKEKLVELFRRLNNGASTSSYELGTPAVRNTLWETDGYLRETLVKYEERNYQHLI